MEPCSDKGFCNHLELKGPICTRNSNLIRFRRKLSDILGESDYIRLSNHVGTDIKIILRDKDFEAPVEKRYNALSLFPYSVHGILIFNGTPCGSFSYDKIGSNNLEESEKFHNNPLSLEFISGILDVKDESTKGLAGMIKACFNSHFYADHMADLNIGLGYKPHMDSLLNEVPYGSVNLTIGRSMLSPVENQRQCPEQTMLNIPDIEARVKIHHEKYEKMIIKEDGTLTGIVTGPAFNYI